MRGRQLVMQWIEVAEDGSAVRGTLVLEQLPAPRVPVVEVDLAAVRRPSVVKAPSVRLLRGRRAA